MYELQRQSAKALHCNLSAQYKRCLSLHRPTWLEVNIGKGCRSYADPLVKITYATLHNVSTETLKVEGGTHLAARKPEF